MHSPPHPRHHQLMRTAVSTPHSRIILKVLLSGCQLSVRKGWAKLWFMILWMTTYLANLGSGGCPANRRETGANKEAQQVVCDVALFLKAVLVPALHHLRQPGCPEQPICKQCSHRKLHNFGFDKVLKAAGKFQPNSRTLDWQHKYEGGKSELQRLEIKTRCSTCNSSHTSAATVKPEVSLTMQSWKWPLQKISERGSTLSHGMHCKKSARLTLVRSETLLAITQTVPSRIPKPTKSKFSRLQKQSTEKLGNSVGREPSRSIVSDLQAWLAQLNAHSRALHQAQLSSRSYKLDICSSSAASLENIEGFMLKSQQFVDSLCAKIRKLKEQQALEQTLGSVQSEGHRKAKTTNSSHAIEELRLQIQALGTVQKTANEHSLATQQLQAEILAKQDSKLEQLVRKVEALTACISRLGALQADTEVHALMRSSWARPDMPSTTQQLCS